MIPKFDMLFYIYLTQSIFVLWQAASSLDKKRYGTALGYSLGYIGLLMFIMIHELSRM